MLEDIWNWLFDCTTITDRITGDTDFCGQPNLMVLLVPAGVVFVYAAHRWSRSVRRGEPPRQLFTPAMRVVLFGSLAVAVLAAFFGPST